MDKKWILLGALGLIALSAALILTAKKKPAPAQPETEQPTHRAETAEPAQKAEPSEPQETLPPLPESVLYYGTVLEVETDENGAPFRLSMESPKDGPFGMNLGDYTFYVDSGEHRSFDPAELQAGDRLYVFHSPMVARSMPPQAAAFLVEKNIPMDVSCGMYRKVEALEQQGDSLIITTDEKPLSLDSQSRVWTYEGEPADMGDLKVGDFVVAWYWDRGEEILRCGDLMILPKR